MLFHVQGANFMNSMNTHCGITYGKETLDSIQGTGRLVFNGTTVKNTVQVNGSLCAEESTMHDLDVNGQADLKNCRINCATIDGFLRADHSHFEGKLSIASAMTVLNYCTLSALTIRECSHLKGVQVVDLRGAQVAGPIIFESGLGEIWVSSPSEISATQIIGGIICYK